MIYDPETNCYLTQKVYILTCLSPEPTHFIELYDDMLRLWPTLTKAILRNILKELIVKGWTLRPKKAIEKEYKPLEELSFGKGSFDTFKLLWKIKYKKGAKMSLCGLV